MTKDLIDLEQIYFDFKGLSGVDYSLRFAHTADDKARIELKDGDHSIIGTNSGDGSTNHLKFGVGSTDLWLTGPNAWENTKIEGKTGDHRVLIEQVGKKGVGIKLGDGSSAIVLGTQDDDHKTKISGGDGNFSVRAGGLDAVRLGHGSHIIDIGLVSDLQVGDGNSQISFKSGSTHADQTVSAGDGSHLLLGDAASENADTKITLGDEAGGGDGSFVQLTSAYSVAEINAGNGDHVIHVEQADKVILRVGGKDDGAGKPLDGYGSQTIVLDQVDGAAIVQMGNGDHAVVVGNDHDDRASQVVAGDGNSRIKIDGGKSVVLGDGNHVIDAGEVSEISVGSGDSRISFETGGTDTAATVTAGQGDHTILALATGDMAKAGIEVGEGDSAIQLMGPDAFSQTKIKGHDGNHSVLVEKANGIVVELKDGNQTVKLADVQDGKTELKLGDGDHRIELGTDAKNSSATVMAGHGDTQIYLDGGSEVRLGNGNHVINAGDVEKIRVGDGNSNIAIGDGAKLSLGEGNHVVRAGEVAEIKTEAGNQHIYFEAGNHNDGVRVSTAGSGDDTLFGMRTDANGATRIESHDGNDIIALMGGRWQKSEVDGGAGHDILFIDQQSLDDGSFSFKNIEEVVVIPSDASWDDLSEIVGGGGFGDAAPQTVFPKGSVQITPIELATVDVAIGDVPEMRSFDLIPTPDPDGFGTAVELVYDDAPLTNLGEGSREDRLMESSTTFFLRAESYELTYQATYTGDFGSEPGYNEFGDYAGSNDSDVMTDTLGSSFIFAMDGDDLIDAFEGDDAIYGGGGDDVMRGGDGQDLLDGGKGYDILNGGADIDIFVFRKGDGTTEIEDFELSFDILDVEGFDNLTYDTLTAAGQQVGDDVYYDLGDDMLILRDVELATMVEIDLCIK